MRSRFTVLAVAAASAPRAQHDGHDRHRRRLHPAPPPRATTSWCSTTAPSPATVAAAHADRFGFELGHVYTSALAGLLGHDDRRDRLAGRGAARRRLGPDRRPGGRHGADHTDRHQPGRRRPQPDRRHQRRRPARERRRGRHRHRRRPRPPGPQRLPGRRPQLLHSRPRPPTTTTATARTSPAPSARSTTPPASSGSPPAPGSGRSRCSAPLGTGLNSDVICGIDYVAAHADRDRGRQHEPRRRRRGRRQLRRLQRRRHARLDLRGRRQRHHLRGRRRQRLGRRLDVHACGVRRGRDRERAGRLQRPARRRRAVDLPRRPGRHLRVVLQLRLATSTSSPPASASTAPR